MTAGIAGFPRHQRRDPLPLCIVQTMSLHPRLPKTEASRFGNLNHERRSQGIAKLHPESIRRTLSPPLGTANATTERHASQCPHDLMSERASHEIGPGGQVRTHGRPGGAAGPRTGGSARHHRLE
jgi:hypothetical protein